MRRPLLALTLALASASIVHANSGRGLVTPRPGRPVHAQRGGRLHVVVQVGSGLTPPPGIQSERALRGFVARLCADGRGLDAPARVCTPLAVRDVRPLDAHSFRYRAELAVPMALAPGRYDLALRFPGGDEEVPEGVVVERAVLPPAVLEESADERVEGAPVLLASAPPDRGASLRLHLGGRGIAVEGASVSYFPRQHDDGSFVLGSVALLELAPGARARITRLAAPPSAATRSLAARRVQAGQAIALAAPADLPGRVFWRLEPARDAEGRAVSTRPMATGRHVIDGIAIDGQGSARRWVVPLEVGPRLPASCALVPVAPSSGLSGLLLAALSWKLAAGRRARARRWNSAR